MPSAEHCTHPGMLRRRLLAALLLAAGPLSHAAAPDSATPLRLLVPPGPLQAPAQVLAEAAQAALGDITVLPAPGRGSGSAGAVVAQSRPQDRMLLMGSLATHALQPWLCQPAGYDALTDFRPLLLMARVPHVLVVTPAAAQGMRNPFDLLRQLRQHPQSLRYASSGWGSLGHIAGELLQAGTGLRIAHLPFPGEQPAMAALLTGAVDMAFDALPAVLPLIRAGRLQALGVTSLLRSPLLPDVASLNDVTGNFNLGNWFGLFAPATLSAEEAGHYAQHFSAALQSPGARARLMAQGILPGNLVLDDFARFVQSEHRKYGLLIQTHRIQPPFQPS